MSRTSSRWAKRFALALCIAGLCAAGAPAQTPPDTRNQLKESATGADRFSKVPVPSWVTQVAVPSATVSSEPNTIRLADTQFRWDGTGQAYYSHHVVQANTTAGIAQLGQIAIPFNPAYQTFQLHQLSVIRNGLAINKLDTANVRFLERELGLEQSMYTGEVTVSILIDDVRVGDALEYSFSVLGANPVYQGVIWEDAMWEATTPVQYRRVSIQAKANHAVRYQFIGASKIAAQVKPTESVHDGLKEWVLEQRDIPPFRVEPAYPAGYQPVTWLQISEYANWNSVAAWAMQLFETPPPTSNEYKSLVVRLKAISDPARRATEALAYVQNEIRYTSVSFGENSHRPATPDEVIARRYGDCKDKSLLLASLYRAVGLDAKLVLVSLAYHSGFGDWLASPAVFDHVIVKLDLKHETYWLDPTAIQKPRNIVTLGRLHDGRDVLVVDRKTDRLTQIARGKPELHVVEERVHLNDLNGPATLERTLVYSGSLAEGLRLYFSKTAPEQINKGYLDDTQRIYSDAEWAGDPVTEDNPDANTITLKAKFALPRYTERTDNGWVLRFKPVYIAHFLTLPNATRRVGPYAIAYPVKVSFLHEVELPANASITAKDWQASIGTAYFKVEETQKRNGRIVSAEYSLESFAREVPGPDMDHFVADIRKAQTDLTTTITIPKDRVAGTNGAAAPEADKTRALADQGDLKAQTKLAVMYARGDGVTQDNKQALALFLKAAQKNYAEAQYYAGLMYVSGQGVPQDFDTSLAWFRKAADQGNTAAQYQLGLMYLKGQGVAQSAKEAIAWYKKAIEKGYAPAQFDMGVLYEAGQGVPQDLAMAATMFKRAAEQGAPAAQAAIGRLYFWGLGVPQSYAEGLSWWRKSADQRYAVAQYYLGDCYQFGRGVPQDFKEAVTWYTRAADQGEARAQTALGTLYANGRGVQTDYKLAADLWRKAADRGNALAQNNYAVALENGRGVAPDLKEAVAWYRKSADQGYARAQTNLGINYMLGKGVDADPKAAVALWQKAVAQNDTNAEAFLGAAYETGNGVSKDINQAITLYRKAADQGNSRAQNSLGILYVNGLGLQKDPVQSHLWFNLAATSGLSDAIKNRDLVATKMTPAQIEAAQKLAREWKPVIPK
jgi:TPR repeat protein